MSLPLSPLSIPAYEPRTPPTRVEASFGCNECGKRYRTKDSLTRHQRNHDNDEQFVCGVCFLHFNRSDVLSRHSRIHRRGRKRSAQACKNCKLAKVKCDAASPCSRCQRSCTKCTYEVETETACRDLAEAGSGIRRTVSVRTPKSRISTSNTSVDGTVPTEHQPSMPHDSFVNRKGNHLGLLPVRQASDPDGDMLDISPTAINVLPSQNILDVPMDLTGMDYEGWPAFDASFSSTDLWSSAAGTSFPNLDFGSASEATQPRSIEQYTGYTGSTSSASYCSDAVRPEMNMQSYTPAARGYSPVGLKVFDQLHQSYMEPSWLRGWEGDLGTRSVDTLTSPTSTSLAQIPTPMIQRKIIEDAVAFAFIGFPSSSKEQRASTYWDALATKVQQAFLGSYTQEARCAGAQAMNYFVRLFFENFHPLWPLFRLRDFDQEKVPATVYLIMTATGAMYSGKGGRAYGSMMIEKLSSALLTSSFLYEQVAEPSDLVLRFMLLTQISALYFGQRSLFQRSQILGTIIVSLARKARLFDEHGSPTGDCLEDDESSFGYFIRTETRRRIAFGIFRADIFTSAVLNTRPLLSPEEINLYSPCSDDIWLYGDEGAWLSSHTSRSSTADILYSDLARISMDRSESMPDLSLAEQGLVLFGMQESIWRFCHDPDLFHRMMGLGLKDTRDSSDGLFESDSYTPASVAQPWPATRARSVSLPTSTQPHLDLLSRKMTDLRQDYDRTILSLRKWEASFANNASITRWQTARYHLLNGRLLYHLSFLRLHADIKDLDQIVSDLSESRSCLSGLVGRVSEWSFTPSADHALQNALAIWSLISRESASALDHRARFNILALIALYQSALVVWAYSGCHPTPTEHRLPGPRGPSQSHSWQTLEGAEHELVIYRANSRALLLAFVDLFRTVTSGWSVVSSFATIVASMAKKPFPVPTDEVSYAGTY